MNPWVLLLDKYITPGTVPGKLILFYSNWWNAKQEGLWLWYCSHGELSWCQGAWKLWALPSSARLVSEMPPDISAKPLPENWWALGKFRLFPQDIWSLLNQQLWVETSYQSYLLLFLMFPFTTNSVLCLVSSILIWSFSLERYVIYEKNANYNFILVYPKYFLGILETYFIITPFQIILNAMILLFSSLKLSHWQIQVHDLEIRPILPSVEALKVKLEVSSLGFMSKTLKKSKV